MALLITFEAAASTQSASINQRLPLFAFLCEHSNLSLASCCVGTQLACMPTQHSPYYIPAVTDAITSHARGADVCSFCFGR